MTMELEELLICVYVRFMYREGGNNIPYCTVYSSLPPLLSTFRNTVIQREFLHTFVWKPFFTLFSLCSRCDRYIWIQFRYTVFLSDPDLVAVFGRIS